MKRFVAAVAACLMLAACTTTSTKLASNLPAKPAPNARILLVKPDIQLAVLTAGGVQEPRPDWSQKARDNLAGEIQTQLKTRSHSYKPFDPDGAMSGQMGQVLRLHQAVGQSIMAYGALLPAKKTNFDWTLGQGAATLMQDQDADYALFIHGGGTYASGGRMATFLMMSMVGVSIPLGQQQVFASLVELKTGRVVWFGSALAGPSADMREPAGAAALTASLLKTLPL